MTLLCICSASKPIRSTLSSSCYSKPHNTRDLCIMITHIGQWAMVILDITQWAWTKIAQWYCFHRLKRFYKKWNMKKSAASDLIEVRPVKGYRTNSTSWPRVAQIIMILSDWYCYNPIQCKPTVFGTLVHTSFPHTLLKFRPTSLKVRSLGHVKWSDLRKFECSSSLHRETDRIQSFSDWYE